MGAAAFEERYGAVFGRVIPGVPVELVTWRVAVQATDGASSLGNAASSPVTPRAGANRLAYFPPTGWMLTPVVDRAALAPGVRHDGPLIVEEAASTTVVGPGDALAIDGGALVWLVIGTIRPYKQVPALVRAFVAARLPASRLVVAGRPMTPASATEVAAAADGSPDVLLALAWLSPADFARCNRPPDTKVVPV